MDAPRISLVIPTQRRLAGLQTAMRSTFRQTGVDLADLELVIVDNDEQPSAQATVTALAADAPFPVIYLHEARPGVATARNTALRRARGALIAFLDDDEEAPEGWLAALLQAQDRFDADVVFGPVRGRAPAEVDRHRAYLERFFSREGPTEAGLTDIYYGCGDSLLRRAALPHPERPFCEGHNKIGGEDTILFAAMRAAGARFAWAPEAWVWEDPAPARLTLRYTVLRAFVYGQGPSSICAAASPPDRLGVAFWMAVGLAQALGYGLLAAFKGLTGSADFAFTLDRYPRDRLGVFTMGEDPVAWTTWRRGSAGDLTGAQLLEAARSGRIWLNLRAANEHLPEYARLCDEVFADKAANSPGLTTFKRDLGVLISSANAQVFYHLDVPLVSLWQIRGHKRVRVYPVADPYVPEQALERIVLREAAEQFAFDPAWDTAAETFDLSPGDMVTWKQNAPHRIENGPMLNVSLSMEFMTPQALLRANVIYANAVLRRTLGARPRIQQGLRPATLAKLAVARAAKALARNRPTPGVLPASFRLDAAAPGALRPA